MRLHENESLFNEAVRATAQTKGIPEIYIEKDYWVTLTLHTIFNDPIGKEVVFKGGTALSKCFGLIERFSEDIDLVVLKKKEESGNQLKNKLKKITNIINPILPEVYIEGLTNKMGMIRKTAHKYSKQFSGNFGQVRDIIVLESSWLGHFEPFTHKYISSYIYEMMNETNQAKLAKEYSLLPFEVRVLDVKRTICEKIMSLVRFSYTAEPISDLKNKVRHLYDLFLLLEDKELKDFLNSKDFDKMLLLVAQDDVVSFKNNNDWLKYHPKEALIFSQIDYAWAELKSTYQDSFKKLVYGTLPEESKILLTLNRIADRLKKVEWTIDL